jgi:hypothetical protein
MAAIYVVDWFDSMIKGPEHLQFLGTKYSWIELGSLVCSIIAMKTQSGRFHAAFAVGSTMLQGSHFLWLFTLRP